MKLSLTKDNILEALVVTLFGLIATYFIWHDLTRERKPSACELNPKSEECYYEQLNNESDQDYQPGAFGPE